MPTVPVYVRVNDLDKWKALKNKAEFIHNALNDTVQLSYASSVPPIPKASLRKQKVEVNKKSHTYTDPVTYKKTNNWGA